VLDMVGDDGGGLATHRIAADPEREIGVCQFLALNTAAFPDAGPTAEGVIGSWEVYVIRVSSGGESGAGHSDRCGNVGQDRSAGGWAGMRRMDLIQILGPDLPALTVRLVFS